MVNRAGHSEVCADLRTLLHSLYAFNENTKPTSHTPLEYGPPCICKEIRAKYEHTY